MNGETRPAPQPRGGPAAAPGRNRLDRVLAYETRRVDKAPRIMPWAAPRATETAPERGSGE
jgi:hypothetical protein